MKPPEFRQFVKEDFSEAPWMEKLIRPLNQVLGQIRAGIDRGLTFGENLNAEVKTVDLGGGKASTVVAASDTHAYAVADVTSGAPGSAAIVGSAAGISGVSIVTVNPPNVRCLRFTFASAMPDTNYVVAPASEYTNGVAMWGNDIRVMAKAVGSFDLGVRDGTSVGSWNHIDTWSHRVSALAYRYSAPSGSGETSAFPLKFETTVKGKIAGVVLLRAVVLNGRDQTPVAGVGGVAWDQSGSTISLRSVTGLSAGSTYRLTLLVVGG